MQMTWVCLLTNGCGYGIIWACVRGDFCEVKTQGRKALLHDKGIPQCGIGYGGYVMEQTLDLNHTFTGKWITDSEFCDLAPRNVFFRQLERHKLDCSEHRNCHILFRRTFELDVLPQKALAFVTADDYFKLYINGVFVSQGPAPSYHSAYNYNVFDVSEYLSEGKNVIAVHTLYQGLVNRVWQSGDNRHGFIFDLEADGRIILCSDESFKTARHTAFSEMGTSGYETQFLERYDSRDAVCGFAGRDYDDSHWENARLSEVADHTLVAQKTKSLDFEKVYPVLTEKRDGGTLFVDFGKIYVGYLDVKAVGKSGDVVALRFGQELCDDKSVRWEMRCNCKYLEEWILSGNPDGDTLDAFDYKAFRYAELDLPQGVSILDISFSVRHYPFKPVCGLRKEYLGDKKLEQVWELCTNSIKYGVQEVIQDCMDREKGFYVGDGCYTALTHLLLTGDDSIVRKLIDDAFYSTFITEGTVTCLDCSFMQEIAEYPLILISLVLWHYRVTGDAKYLEKNYPHIIKLLDSYRDSYEKDGLICDLDKWCVVEWPANYRDGYDVDIAEGKVCHTAHISINAYYLEAVHTANTISQILGKPAYRDEMPMRKRMLEAFYDREAHLFNDSVESTHKSYIGNIFGYGYIPTGDPEFERNMLEMTDRRGVTDVNMFGMFVMFQSFSRYGKDECIRKQLLNPGAWLNMIDEGAKTTFEAWGKDCKWNTSLFHLTLSSGAVFMADIDRGALFGY